MNRCLKTQTVQEATAAGENAAPSSERYHPLGWACEKDIVRVPGVDISIISFYKSAMAYNAAQLQDMKQKGLTDSDVSTISRYSVDDFIPRGNIPTYNGHKVFFVCGKDADEGLLCIDYKGHQITISRIDRGEVSHLIAHGLNIIMQEPTAGLESKVA